MFGKGNRCCYTTPSGLPELTKGGSVSFGGDSCVPQVTVTVGCYQAVGRHTLGTERDPAYARGHRQVQSTDVCPRQVVTNQVHRNFFQVVKPIILAHCWHVGMCLLRRARESKE